MSDDRWSDDPASVGRPGDDLLAADQLGGDRQDFDYPAAGHPPDARRIAVRPPDARLGADPLFVAVWRQRHDEATGVEENCGLARLQPDATRSARGLDGADH